MMFSAPDYAGTDIENMLINSEKVLTTPWRIGYKL